jgi:hypothetical protein
MASRDPQKAVELIEGLEPLGLNTIAVEGVDDFVTCHCLLAPCRIVA